MKVSSDFLWKVYLTSFFSTDTMFKESKLSIKRGVKLKNRLEEIRKKNCIKQEDLASELEVSRQTIGSLENGRYNPSIILAFKIARFFNMSIEDIFIYEEDKK